MTFEEEFEVATLKRIFLSVRGARQDRRGGFDPGRATEGAYKVVGNQVIMCDAHGREVVDHDGRRYRHTLKLDAEGKTPSGELNEREAAGRLVREIKSSLKIGGNHQSGFEPGQAIRYPRHYFAKF